MTLAQILAAVAAGTTSAADAQTQIQQLIDAAADRASCARAALTGYIARGVKFGNSEALAAQRIADADAIVAAIGAQS